MEASADPTSISDFVAAFVGAIALIAALVLTFLGYRIAADFSEIRVRVERIENQLRSDSTVLFALRTSSAIIGRLAAESFSVHDLTRRVLLDSLPTHSSKQRNLFAAYKNNVGRGLQRLSRVSLYARLLDPHRTGSLDDALDELVSKHPDRDTIAFLEATRPFFDKTERPLLDGKLAALSHKIIGFDYTRWARR
jgi:CRISPR/Cas system-associated protein endoribonuclease Cas2